MTKWVGILGIVLSVPAWAATPDRCQADRQCRQLTEMASQLAAHAQYEEALAAYQRAYERVPEPRLLVNLGRCHFRLGRAQKALGLYRSFQKTFPDTPPELEGKLKQFIAEAEEAVAKEQAIAPPPGPAPAPTESGKKEEVAASAPPVLTPAKADSSLPGARSAESSTGRPAWRIAVGASALGAGAVLVGLGAWALSLDGQCITDSPLFPGRCATTTGSDGQLTAQVRDGLPTGIGLFVTGSVLAVAGVVLIALPGSKSRRQEQPKPQLSHGTLGVSWLRLAHD